MLVAKKHRKVDYRGNVWEVTALCDKSLLGKVLKEGEVTLDLLTHRRFYDGQQVGQAEAVALLKSATNINVVGKEAVECAKKALPVDGRRIRSIRGVPHLQVYYL